MNYRREKNYYAVTCKCGHTGSRKTYIPIEFGVVAANGKEAALIGRGIPRCKHNHKDCVLSVRKISYEEYILIRKRNIRDPYLRCSSIQEQSQYDLSDRFVKEDRYKDDDYEEEERKSMVFSGKHKIKNPKKFIRFNYAYAMEVSY